MKNLDRLIEIIRENMISPMPTNNISSGNVAKYDPILHFNKKKSGKVDGRSVKRRYKDWMKYLNVM
jgi:hypothetical protein